MPRGWGGWCWWYFFLPQVQQGNWPKVRIGTQEIPLIPGMGVGRMLLLSLLAGSGQEIKVEVPKDVSKEELESVRKEIEELKKSIKDLEEKLAKIAEKLQA